MIEGKVTLAVEVGGIRVQEMNIPFQVERNPSLDWNVKESVFAAIREATQKMLEWATEDISTQQIRWPIYLTDTIDRLAKAYHDAAHNGSESSWRWCRMSPCRETAVSIASGFEAL